MDKRIRSVKLKNDYRTLDKFIPAGTPIHFDGELWVCNGENYQALFTEKQMSKNETGLFEIKYEPERKSITVKIEYDESQYFSRDITPEDIEYFISGSTVQYGNINVTEVTND